MSAPVLVSHGLAVGYGRGWRARVVLRDVDVALRAGEFACLLGPNGAGKSTLLRTLAGMQRPLVGQVRLGGEDVHYIPPDRLARRLSVVLTEKIEVGLLSVYALVALGRHPYTDWTGRLRKEDEAVAWAALEAVGAAELAARSVHELSDGERQKIMIARALAQEPDVMILDEPTAYLDLPRRVEIMQLLRRLAHDFGCAVLASTHDLDLALRSADTVWLLPPGGPLQAGAPEDLVLAGSFERAFHSAGTGFDPATGAFRLLAGAGAEVSLVGEGLGHTWALRALERAGYRISTAPGPNRPRITAAESEQRPCWQVAYGEQERHFGTLAEVLDYLQSVYPAHDPAGI